MSVFGLGSAGSMNMNGQLVAAPMSGAFYPSGAQAASYTGNGQGPATIPLNYMGSNSTTSSTGAAAAANPFNPAVSPLWISIFALIVGMLGLRYIHWRG
jgi:hypothetical protein